MKIGDRFKYFEIPIIIKDYKPFEDIENGYWKNMVILESNIKKAEELYKKEKERFIWK